MKTRDQQNKQLLPHSKTTTYLRSFSHLSNECALIPPDSCEARSLPEDREGPEN